MALFLFPISKIVAAPSPPFSLQKSPAPLSISKIVARCRPFVCKNPQPPFLDLQNHHGQSPLSAKIPNPNSLSISKTATAHALLSQQIETKVFYFDVGENKRGHFLKATKLFIPTRAITPTPGLVHQPGRSSQQSQTGVDWWMLELLWVLN